MKPKSKLQNQQWKKKYRRLRRGEIIRKGDVEWSVKNPSDLALPLPVFSDRSVGSRLGKGIFADYGHPNYPYNYFFRPL